MQIVSGSGMGCATPSDLHNCTTRREIDILEIPLTIMDNTLDKMQLDIGMSWN